MKILTQTEKCAISKLLTEIKDGSLETILRRTIFGEKLPIENIVRHERPQYSEEEISDLFSAKGI